MPLVNFTDLFLQADNLRHTGQVNAAMAAYVDIARLAKTDDVRLQARAVRLAGVSATLAILDRQSSYYRDATNYLKAALAGYRDLSDPIKQGLVLSDLGSSATAAGQTAEAEDYYRQSLIILTKESATVELGVNYARLGLLYVAQQKLEAAQRFMDQALTILRREPTAGFFQASVLLDMAKLQFVESEFDQALTLLQEGQSWFEADHEPEMYTYYLAEAVGLSALLRAAAGQKRGAEKEYQHFSLLTRLFDPLVTERLKRKLEALAHLRETLLGAGALKPSPNA